MGLTDVPGVIVDLGVVSAGAFGLQLSSIVSIRTAATKTRHFIITYVLCWSFASIPTTM